MNAPAFSTFSAIAELFVTAAVVYVVVRNFRGMGFAWRLASVVIVFEFSVNMLYMISRMRADAASGEMTGPWGLFAAGHGLLSLIVFILLVIFSFQAFQASKRGSHFFQEHRGVTYSFLALWMVSVVSGEVLYVVRYLI